MYIYMYIHTFIHIHMHIYIHTYIHTYTHKYIHTYTHFYRDKKSTLGSKVLLGQSTARILGYELADTQAKKATTNVSLT